MFWYVLALVVNGRTSTFFEARSLESIQIKVSAFVTTAIGPRQANLVLIAYASSEDSGEPAHPRSLARTFAVRSYKQ